MSCPLSSYLYAKSPNSYGGQQDDYLDQALLAIRHGSEEIQKDRPSKNVEETFFNIWETFCQKRYAIAEKHKTENFYYFGHSRSSPASATFVSLLTPLARFYERYNAIFMDQLKPILLSMKTELGTFIQERKIETHCLGIQNSFTVKIVQKEEISKLLWDQFPTEQEVQTTLKTTKTLTEISDDYSLMLQLKTTNKPLYERITIGNTIDYINKNFPSTDSKNSRNTLVLGTLRIEIQGQLFAFSRFLTWMDQDSKTDCIERMAENSKTIIIHQDPFLIQPTLRTISRVFQEAASWNPSHGLQDLKNKVAKFRFMYSHCTPCFRGDGAIGDWLELALYYSHGFTKTRYNNDRLPCFETLASLSLSRYLENYDEITHVE